MSGDADLSWRRIGRVGPDEGSDFRPRRRSPPPSLAEEIRIARGDPQAVVRILSYRRGTDAVLRTARYVVTKAERFTIDGGIELAAEAVGDVIDGWACDFSHRANARDIVHLEVSAPPGTDRDRFHVAAAAFAAEVFGERHAYLLAEHRDTPHPHCHLLVKLDAGPGVRLDPRKSDLAHWRTRLATAAREQGIALAASSCRERGVAPRGVSRAAYAKLRSPRRDAAMER